MSLLSKKRTFGSVPTHAASADHLPPFFDRFSTQGTVFLDEEGVKQSVKSEVANLLNTRFVLKESEEHDLRGASPLSFGMPDLSADLLKDREASEAMIHRIIAYYEPRLDVEKVALNGSNQAGQKLCAAVQGVIYLGEKSVRLSFSVDLNQKEKST